MNRASSSLGANGALHTLLENTMVLILYIIIDAMGTIFNSNFEFTDILNFFQWRRICYGKLDFQCDFYKRVIYCYWMVATMFE